MSGQIEVAAVQFAARPGEVEDNLGRFARAVREHAAGAQLIVGPETLAIGYDLELIDALGAALAEDVDGPTASLAGELAAETGATIVVGVLELDGEAFYDSALIVAAGAPPRVYRKTHLYPPERRRFRAGEQLLVAQTPAARVGVMICFEHAFPEIATTLALGGAQVLAIPSAIPRGFEHLVGVRTRARAQDNQLFAIAANLTGGSFFGGSMIVDPRGKPLVTAGEDETVIRATLDLDEIEREREREPALALRRPDLYGTRRLSGDGR